jgi:hypothetical protein
MVLDDGDGPELCLGGVATSLPPQCEGVAVSGWDWADHPDHESASGSRWGDYVVEGEWDGTTFTAAKARPVAEGDRPQGEDGPATTSCEEPEDGWRVVDPATTNRAAWNRVGRVAEALPDYGLLFGDQSINPRWQDYLDGDWSMEVTDALNDPALTIVNVGVTGDPAAAEPKLREVWGGPLCVYRLANTQERLREVAEELRDLPGGLNSGYGSISNRVELSVVHDDGSIQAWVDEEYGEDVVEVYSALQPVD